MAVGEYIGTDIKRKIIHNELEIKNVDSMI